MRQRTLSRELALQTLYRLSFQKDTEDMDIIAFLDETIKSYFSLSENETKSIPTYTKEIVNGYIQNQNKINDAIKKSSANWEFKRITLIDRAIMQIATYELLFRTDIPQAVSINEAIELAKKYGGKESHLFVNGILDKIASENMR